MNMSSCSASSRKLCQPGTCLCLLSLSQMKSRVEERGGKTLGCFVVISRVVKCKAVCWIGEGSLSIYCQSTYLPKPYRTDHSLTPPKSHMTASLGLCSRVLMAWETVCPKDLHRATNAWFQTTQQLNRISETQSQTKRHLHL
jgi:hypothetical protein